VGTRGQLKRLQRNTSKVQEATLPLKNQHSSPFLTFFTLPSMSSSFQVPSSPDVLEDTVAYTQCLFKAHQLKRWFADQENMPCIQAIFNTQPLMILGQTIIKYLRICDTLYDQTAGLTKMINQLANLLIQTPQYEAFTLSMEASTRQIIQPSTMFNPRMAMPNS
jgi:hypothetical protein